MSASITVVGIGADGWAGLTDAARQAIRAADEVVGSARQLASLPHDDDAPPRRPWPSPLEPLLDTILAATDGRRVCVLASGDPMHYGIGATIARRLGPGAVASGRLSIHTHPSAFSLACARLGWPAQEATLISTVGWPVHAVLRELQPGRRLVIYLSGTDGATALAHTLTAAGAGPSAFHVLEQLGGPAEQIRQATAATWAASHDPLTCVAVEVALAPDAPTGPLAATPGLPDAAYLSDGLVTKRHVRASTLAALVPLPGQRLWDVGAGSGSIAIEWLRAEPSARAIAIESRPDRAERIRANAARLGVPQLEILEAAAPAALDRLHDTPDAVFVGGASAAGCWRSPGSASPRAAVSSPTPSRSKPNGCSSMPAPTSAATWPG